jgi:hypothetical protein
MNAKRVLIVTLIGTGTAMKIVRTLKSHPIRDPLANW